MKKQLMRSRKNNVIAGVCGGIADYFNIDVFVVRLLWIVSAMFDGPGVLVYIICAVLIPKAPYGYPEEKQDEDGYMDDKKERSKNYMALGFIGIGIYLSVMIIFPWLNFKFLWPVGLILVGIYMLNNKKEREADHES